MNEYYAFRRDRSVSAIRDSEILFLDYPIHIAKELLGVDEIEFCSQEIWLLEFMKALQNLAPEPLAQIIEQERHRVRFEIQLLAKDYMAKPESKDFGNYRGVWSRAERYYSGDIVSVDGALFHCLKFSTTKPGPNNAHWEPVSQRAMV